MQNEYVQQMGAYMLAMELLPPESRAETPAEMQRHESALDRQIRERYNIMCEERAIAGRMRERVMGRIEAPPRQPEFEISWVNFGYSQVPVKKKKKVPERKNMNSMSYTIHNHLCVAIEDGRGKNALLSISTIIEERLIAKDCFDNGTYDGLVSYTARKGKLETMKLGRFIKRHILKESILPENIFQSCIEGLVNHFFPTCVFEVHSGDQITRNYEKCVGGGSCMAGDNAPKVAMYADNPTKFTQLIGKQNRNTARAILFHMDDGHVLLGRIYCGSLYLSKMMAEYAKKKGWIYGSTYDLYRKGEPIGRKDHDFTISEVKWKEGGVPYMDDFEYGNIEDDGTLTLFFGNSGDYCLQCCSGTLRDDLIYCCCCDSGYMDEDNAYSDGNGDNWCHDCYNEYFTNCDECEETIHIDNMRAVDSGSVCESCHDNCYVTCIECESDFHADNMTTLYNGEEVCKDCLDESYTLCDDCEQYTKDETTEVTGGEEVCKYCLDESYTMCEECEEHVKETTASEDDRELCENCKELCYAETE
jgi:hypothetical protein